MSIDQEKSDLRARARLVRKAAHETTAVQSAIAISATGLDFLELTPDAIVSGYASIGDELGTGPLLARMSGIGVALALPVTMGRGCALVFRSWQPGDDMNAGFQNIAEPLPSARQVYPDIVLVPLLAYDGKGYRLGYGGGHYDRSLADLRKEKRVVAVGLAYDEQKVDAVPHDRYDQRLDWILTPSGADAFGEL